jgi:hypothetical protein
MATLPLLSARVASNRVLAPGTWLQRPDKPAFCLVLVWLMTVNLLRPIQLSPDSHTYIAWADKLIELRFNWAAYLAWNDFFTPAWFYLVPVTLFALLRTAMAEAWIYGLLAINLACVSFLLLAFWRCARLLGAGPWAVVLGLISLAAATDLLVWPHYMLSDTVYAALVTGAVWHTLHRLVAQQQRGWRLLAPLLPWAVLAAFSRPASPAFIAALLAVPVMVWSATRWCHSGKVVLLALAGAGVMLSVAYAVFIKVLPDAWPALSASRGFQMALAHVSEGGVIHDRPETYIGAPHGLGGVMQLYLLRLASFFSPYAAGFSKLHLALNCLQGGVLAIGLVGVLWRFSELAVPQRAAVLFLLAVAGCTAAYHSAILIDYDWRYRFPVVVPLALLAAVGWGRTLVVSSGRDSRA